MRDNIIVTKHIQPTLELYGVQGKVFRNMTYENALKYKIELLRPQVTFILDQDYRTRDSTKLNRILDAIKFNEDLLKELY